MNNLLMISPYLPYPPSGGGHVRIKNIYEGLSQFANVTLIAPGKAIDLPHPLNNTILAKTPADNRLHKLKAVVGKYPYHYALWYSKDLLSKVQVVLSNNQFDLIYCHFIYTVPYLQDSILPIIVDTHNVDHLYWERKIKYYLSTQNYLKAIASKISLFKTKKFELEMLRNASAIVSVSTADDRVIRETLQDESKTYLVAPNGVDTDRFKLRVENRSDNLVLGFLGSMDLDLNIDAALLLCEQIFPKVREILPDNKVSLLIIGKNPPKKLKDIAVIHSGGGINLTGTVDDVAQFLPKVDIMVFPLRSGAGTKLRVFETLATGVCIVGSDLAFDGIDELIDGEHVFKANNIPDIVEKICWLARNPDLRIRFAENGRELVVKKYDWGNITRDLSLALDTLC